MKDAHGVGKDCIYRWEKLYHETIHQWVEKKGINKIGGNFERCAVDETAVGKPGVMVGKKPQKQGNFKRGADRIKAKRPCKTIWKKGAKPFPKKKKWSTSKKTQWLWLGVQCGKDGKEPRSHKKGNKRVAAEVCPHPTDLPKGRGPRDGDSLAAVMQKRVRKKSKLASDGWGGTAVAAAKQKLPLKQCNHKQNMRDPKTGVHTNDAESEASRYKLWSRGKWSKVRSINKKTPEAKQKHLKQHVSEYIAQTNVGENMMLKMEQVMEAFRLRDSGKKYKAVKLS